MLTSLLMPPMSVAIAIGLISLTATVVRADGVVPSTTLSAIAASKIARSACQKAQSNQVALDFNPAYNREKFVGEVQSVSNAADGNTIVLKQDDQQVRHIFLPNSIGGNFENLVGKRIVLTRVVCSAPITAIPDNPSEVPPQSVVPQQW